MVEATTHPPEVTQVQEGRTTKAVERRTAQIPSQAFLWAAGGSILLSLGLRAAHRTEDAIFVGHWPPVFLLLGVYNKLVKVAGHE